MSGQVMQLTASRCWRAIVNILLHMTSAAKLRTDATAS